MPRLQWSLTYTSATGWTLSTAAALAALSLTGDVAPADAWVPSGGGGGGTSPSSNGTPVVNARTRTADEATILPTEELAARSGGGAGGTAADDRVRVWLGIAMFSSGTTAIRWASATNTTWSFGNLLINITRRESRANYSTIRTGIYRRSEPLDHDHERSRRSFGRETSLQPSSPLGDVNDIQRSVNRLL